MAPDIESLWIEHHNGLYAYVYRRLRDVDTANDLLSAIYLRVVVAIRNGKGPATSVHGWLFAIARNVLNDHWRAKKHTRFIDWDALPEYVDEYADPDATVARQMEADRLYQAMTQLPDSQAQTAMLRLEGYDYDEIAACTGRSRGAAKAVMTRAYANLRAQLGEAA